MTDGNWQAIKYVLDGTDHKPEDKVSLNTTVITVSIDEEE